MAAPANMMVVEALRGLLDGIEDAAAMTSIDLDPNLGTPDAEGDLVQLTGADAAQDNNNATIAAQFNALRADVIALRTQFNALLAKFEAV